MRYDLALFLCCCKSFVGSSEDEEESFYDLLGIDRDASLEEIKKAYKKKSLQMHPDKLAQRGLTVTPELQAKFTRMKEAYECLKDPHKRETYDAIGEKLMKWIEEPMSMDPQELAHNFSKASILDRSKVFAIFVAIAVIVLCLPVVVCLHLDGVLGNDASWILSLIPLWLGNFLALLYHSKVVTMSPVPKPEDVPAEEWVDPFPLKDRVLSLVRFLLIATFEFLVALQLDAIIDCQWALVFLPLLAWELTNVYEKWSVAVLPIITIEEVEEILGKPYTNLTVEEIEAVEKKYRVVMSLSDASFDLAYETRQAARQELMKSFCRLLFMIILVVRLDTTMDFNWWLGFLPFWITILMVCVANYQAFAKVKLDAELKDPELFGIPNDPDEELGGTSTNNETTNANNSNVDYGSVGTDGLATPEAAAASTLTQEEKEKLKEEVVNSGSKLCTQCCSQGFVLIILCLIVGKLQGASFSTLWLISPLLFVAGIMLCCLGIAIFGVTEVPDMVDGNIPYEPETTAVNPATNFQNPSTTVQPPIALAQNSNDKVLHQSSVEPKADEESGTIKGLSSTAEASSQSNTTAEIRELD